jgi:hypothetical protein
MHLTLHRYGAAMALVCLAFCLRLGTDGAHAAARPTPDCGPADASSLAEKEGVRFYPAPDGAGPRVDVCSSAARPAPLGSGAVFRPFAVAFPWAAGVERGGVGQDTAFVNVVGVDTLSRKRASCLLGQANRPGQIPKVERLWATRRGVLVISALMKLSPVGPELAICSGRTLETIAGGTTFDPSSIDVEGDVVRWTQAGEAHARHL